jgi:hypothetical protein
MKFDLTTGAWKVLRALVREPALNGRALRNYDYSRRSQDGTFLDDLCAAGLIEHTGETVPVDHTDRAAARRPVQFRQVYRLTAAGRVAAEYGEYEREPNRPAPPPGPQPTLPWGRKRGNADRPRGRKPAIAKRRS